MTTPFATPSEKIAWTLLQDKHRGRYKFAIRGYAFIAETPWGVLPIEVYVGATVGELDQKLEGATSREGTA